MQTIGEPELLVRSNFEKSLTSLDGRWQKKFRRGRKAEILEGGAAYRVRHRQNRAWYDHGLHQVGVELCHLEGHHAAVAKSHHRAPLNPQLPQPLHQALRLERRRPVQTVGVGPPEEEEVWHINWILARQRPHLPPNTRGTKFYLKLLLLISTIYRVLYTGATGNNYTFEFIRSWS